MPPSISTTIGATAGQYRRRLLLVAGTFAFWPLAPVAIAQIATQSIANQNPLPLRNIQIEVRQVHSRNREEAGAQLDRDARLRLGQQREQLSGTSTQMALVLNGRSTRITLHSTAPFRLMQTQFRNGRPVLVPGVVLLETTTGFVATPRWDGSDQVELDIAATSLVLPLGDWVTVAQSEAESSARRSGLLGHASGAEQHSSELQVRVTVR